MKMYVPEIGDRLELVDDWSFKLFNEYRNESIRDGLGLALPPEYNMRSREIFSWEVTLPQSTVLSVDRIYVRKGASDFSSLSFCVIECPLSELTPVKQGGSFTGSRRRFWAKLEDCNRILFKKVEKR